jgi:hypothetical protein
MFATDHIFLSLHFAYIFWVSLFFFQYTVTVEEKKGGWVVIWLTDGYTWTVNMWVTYCKMNQREENNSRESSQARGKL